MPKLTVFTGDTKRKIPFSLGSTVREILDAASLEVRSGCTGNGACGLCLVRVEAGKIDDPTENEQLNLSPEQIGQNIRLACQLMPENDLSIRIIKPVTISERENLLSDQLCFAPSLFEAFIKLAQYIVRLKTQQDIRDHLGKFITTYFPADWTAFVQRDSVNGISVHHCTPSEAVDAEHILTDDVRTLIADVLDSGFLASQVILTPAPSMTAFLPIVEEYQQEKVIMIGHRSADPLSRELLNIYLAIAGLAGTTFERLRNERELNRHRAHLEELIKERTAELDAANKELEAFSYSVSHDLRSPLRSITGFSQILLDDYAERLDDEGKDLLNRIIGGGRRMEQLISALLNLSRVSRSEMRCEKVDLTAMAWKIAKEFRTLEPERKVEFTITDGLIVEGDGHLLYQVIENLMGNAWKFTKNRETARIDFGLMQRGDERIYFLRDNGAGFNMAYVEKLFNPFQRLHKMSDYSGTGIGLATVKRIVGRHGGRVWIEGELEKGSTVYFTLS